MKVGETYEVHWPHSAAGACGTRWQHQTPFYDGLLCNDAAVTGVMAAGTLPSAIGVEAQVFTVVNDEFHHLDLNIDGSIKSGDAWTDVARYIGSSTGDSRTNEQCSAYAPITWQVDRKCHLISASSFDALCQQIKQQPGMQLGGRNAATWGDDLEPHGARETVPPALTADNINDGLRA